jgi:hypothetical protein
MTNPVVGSFTEGRANGRHFQYLSIASSTGLGVAPYVHSVEIGGHVLEDTHQTRDGWPMSVYKSFLTGTYSVVVDTNDYM